MLSRFMTVMVVITPLVFTTYVAARSQLEDVKETALEIEVYLEKVQTEAEEALAKGEICKEAWKQFCTISWHGRELLRVMTMAALLYEEAPSEKHRVLIAQSAMSMMGVLIMLENFCDTAGIEIEPPDIYKATAMREHERLTCRT